MRRFVVFGVLLLLPACNSGKDDGGNMGSVDAAAQDSNVAADASGAADVAMKEVDTGNTSDAPPDAADRGGSEGSAEGACPSNWLDKPAVDPSITIVADSGAVLVHASATGTQNYACAQGGDGGFGWTFVGPQAELHDCNASVIGHHFASEAGASAPEWLLDDGSYAVGHKVAQFVPDGGASSVPWLLLQVTGRSDAGILGQATYVHRLNTNGGIAPSDVCGADSGAQMVPYTADYYFYGP
jgi:hypothetical protein